MGFTDVVRKAFPFIAAAASLGGPIGTMAAAAVGKAIGADHPIEPTSDGISNAIAVALADPQQRAALIQAEQEFQKQMTELGYQHAEELDEIAATDRASARQREVQVRDWTPRLLAYAIIVAFIAVTVYVLSGHAKVETVLAGTLIGYMSAKAELVLTYYFGSSSDSDRKTELLAQAQPQK